jgi:hypothetical protein
MGRLVAVVAVLFAGLGVVALPGVPVPSAVARSTTAGQTVPVQTVPEQGPTTLPILPEGAGDPIPRPNSGVAPDDPGDRGGWQQVLVLCLLGGGLLLVGSLAARDIRRKRAGRAG